MATSRGKAFEKEVRESVLRCQDVSLDRFPDPMAGYSGVRNICDFLIYSYPTLIYLECKAYTGNTLNFSAAITKDQWKGLLEKSQISGVLAGVLVWFIDYDVTAFVPIQELERLRVDDKKSLNIKDIKNNQVTHFLLKGKKKRVMFTYDFQSFLNEIKTLSQP